jgi:hypothetical protein
LMSSLPWGAIKWPVEAVNWNSLQVLIFALCYSADTNFRIKLTRNALNTRGLHNRAVYRTSGMRKQLCQQEPEAIVMPWATLWGLDNKHKMKGLQEETPRGLLRHSER